MLDAALNIGDASAGVALVPGAVERFRGGPKLHDEVAGNVLRLNFAPLLAPKAHKGCFVAAHDDPSIRTADEGAAIEMAVYPLANPHYDLLFLTGASRSVERQCMIFQRR